MEPSVVSLPWHHGGWSLMNSKKTTFLDAVSLVALTVLTAIFYVYSAILLELWLLKRQIRMGGSIPRRRR